jgi:hypothetical protein
MGLAELVLFGRPRSGDAFANLDAIRARRPDIARGLGYWERACFLEGTTSSTYVCWELRELLTLPDAPRRNDDDWLPLLAELVRMGPAVPAAAPGSGGICELDPTACPKSRTVQFPPHLVANAPREHARILAVHRDACARGVLRACHRLVELELLRFPHSLTEEKRNQAAEPIVEVTDAPFDLCARGVAEACVTTTYFSRGWSKPPRIGGLPELQHGCAIGSALACAIAAHRLEATGDARGAAPLLARACSGGVRWACP